MADEDDPFAAMQQFIGRPAKGKKFAPRSSREDAANAFDEEVDYDGAGAKASAKSNDDERRKTRQRQNTKILRRYNKTGTATKSRNKNEMDLTEDEVLALDDQSDDELCHVSPPKLIAVDGSPSSKTAGGGMKKKKPRETKRQHEVNAALEKICATDTGFGDDIAKTEETFVATAARTTRSKANDSRKATPQPTDDSQFSLSLTASQRRAALSDSITSDSSLHTEDLQSVSIRHLARAKTERFIMRLNETFERVLCELVEAETAERNASASRCRRVHCALTHNGAFVSKSSTLSELGWSLGDQLEVAFVELVRLIFCTSEQHRKTTLECSSDVKFSSLIERLAKELRVPANACITLHFDGAEIDMFKTPDDYEMEDDERIDVHIKAKST